MARNLPKKSRLHHSPVPAMTRRPELAVYIARVTVAWSRAEQALAFVFAQMLGADAHIGMKMYMALSGSAAKNAVLNSVIVDRLPPDMQADIAAILKEYRRVAKKRNNIVHGEWSLCLDYPDDLVWNAAHDTVLGYSHFWAGWNAQKDKEGQFEWANNHKWEETHYSLYGKAEFEELLNEIKLVSLGLLNFNHQCEHLHKLRRQEAGLEGW